MQNSCLLVFSFLANAKTIIDSDWHDFGDVFKIKKHQYNHANKYIKSLIKKIYNELENHIYTYKDILVFMLYEHAIFGEINFYHINSNTIKKIKTLFTKKQLQKDKEFLEAVCKELQLNDFCSLFEIKYNKTSIAYEYVKNNLLSPIIFILCKKDLTNIKKDDILCSSYTRFLFSINTILKILKGGFDE